MDLIGEDILGFTTEDVGLHSIRSGGAMAMFLSKTSVIIMMRVGRWSSEAFLEYIRQQVENFTVGVSQNMLAYECYFVLVGHNDQAQTPSISATDNKNGPVEVPFDVTFSNLAIDDSAGLTRTFRRRK